jgi:hypothetical protein
LHFLTDELVVQHGQHDLDDVLPPDERVVARWWQVGR